MTTTLDARFGSYIFTNELERFELESASRVNPIAIPRRAGFLTDTAYPEGMRIRLGGLIVGSSADDARSTLNLLKNALNGGKQLLRLYSTREVLAQKVFFASRFRDGLLWTIEWDADLLTEDAYFSSVNETATENTISASPQTDTHTNNGNAETPAVIRITAGSVEIASGLRIDNLTTGEYFTYNQAIPIGEYVDIDTSLLTVVDDSSVNQIANFAQDFFKLAAGDNSIKWTGTATGSPKLKFTYKERYDGF